MSNSTGTKRIIENYVANGGASMDEDHYQLYKAAMLTNWLDKLYAPLIEGEAHWYVCLDCIDGEAMNTQQAINHLRLHHPDWFAV